MKAYVAGPFRASNQWEQEQNIRYAEEIALTLWSMGLATICPHLNTRYFQGVLPDDVWLRGDLELLAACDIVVMTQNWQMSEGAREENKLANLSKLPIFVWNDREWDGFNYSTNQWLSAFIGCGKPTKYHRGLNP